MEFSIIPECEAYLEMEHVHWLVHMLLFPHCRCQTSYYTQTNPVGEIKLYWTTEAIDGCKQKHKYQCQETILKFCNLNKIEVTKKIETGFFLWCCTEDRICCSFQEKNQADSVVSTTSPTALKPVLFRRITNSVNLGIFLFKLQFNSFYCTSTSRCKMEVEYSLLTWNKESEVYFNWPVSVVQGSAKEVQMY